MLWGPGRVQLQSAARYSWGLDDDVTAVFRYDHLVGRKRDFRLLFAVDLNERESPDALQARLLFFGEVLVVKTDEQTTRQHQP